ncbi:MAG: MFS transporter [Candidatus Thorarchaeota archaeon]
MEFTTSKVHLTYLLSSAAILASVTFIPIYGDSIGLSKSSITTIVAFYSFFAFLGSFISGRMSDFKGRKIIIIIGLISSAITFTGQFFANSELTLLIIRVLAGLSAGIAPPVLIAYAYELKYKMGSFSSFGSFGWGIGTVTAGEIALLFSSQYVFLLSGFFFFLSFVIALKFPKEEKIEEDALRDLGANLPVSHENSLKIFLRNLPVYIPLFMRHSAASGVWTLWPLFLKDVLSFNDGQIGLVQGTNALTQFAVMWLLTDHLPADKSFELGLLMSGITFLSFLITSNFYLFLLTQVLLGFSWSNNYVGAVIKINESNPDGRGTATGFLTAIISVSGLVGPVYAYVFLFYFNEIDIYYVLIIFAALMSFSAFLIHFIYRLISNRKKKPFFDRQIVKSF